MLTASQNIRIPLRPNSRSSSESSHPESINGSCPDDTDRAMEIEDASVFDYLNVLRRRLFVARDVLEKNVIVASKDASGQLDWLTLEKGLHTALVKRAIWLICEGISVSSTTVERIKNSFFLFLLEVLNGGDSSFFDLQDGSRNDNRANRERKRLARKRARAAKRERQRVELKGGHEAIAKKHGVAEPRKCLGCSQSFTSRKALKRHRKLKGCKVPAVVEKTAEVVVVSTTAQTHSGSTPAVTVPSLDTSADLGSSPKALPQTSDTPEKSEVEDYVDWATEAGEERVCENCDDPASFVKIRGSFKYSSYLKCDSHAYTGDPTVHKIPPELFW